MQLLCLFRANETVATLFVKYENQRKTNATLNPFHDSTKCLVFIRSVIGANVRSNGSSWIELFAVLQTRFICAERRFSAIQWANTHRATNCLRLFLRMFCSAWFLQPSDFVRCLFCVAHNVNQSSAEFVTIPLIGCGTQWPHRVAST